MPVRAIIAWVLVVPCAMWLLVRALGVERGYPMVPLLAFTPLVVVGSALVAVAALLLRQREAAGAAAVVAVVLAGLVVPRALGGPKDTGGPRLRVLTANLHHDPRAARELARLVRRTHPDVVSLQEVTPEVAAELERARLGLHALVDARPGGFGSALFARMPLRRRAAPGAQTMTVAAASVPGAPPLELYAVHPRAPLRGENMDEWRANLRGLPSASSDGTVRILAGDFNATLDHAELRRVIRRGYEDAGDALGSGLRTTWPSDRHFPPPVTIDHVLADTRCDARSLDTFDVRGSDHRAVLVELALPRAS